MSVDFAALSIAPNGNAIGDFPRYEPVNHSLVYIDAAKNQAARIARDCRKEARDSTGVSSWCGRVSKLQKRSQNEKEGEKPNVPPGK